MKLYQIGLKNLKRRKVRTFLITLGLSLAVAIEVGLIGVTKSFEADFDHKLDEFGANILIVPRSNELSLDYGGLPISGVSFGEQKLSMLDVKQIPTIENSENIGTISPQLFHVADVNGHKTIIAGIDFKPELRLKRWWKYSGVLPDQADQILVGSKVSAALGLKPGDDLQIEERHFTVSGILTATGSQDDNLIFASLPVVQRLFNSGDDLSMIEVSALCYNCPIGTIVSQIRAKLPNATVTPLRQAIESKMDAMHRIQRFSVFLSLAVALFAALMIFVNMMSSVSEREKEIGIFRTVGFKRRHILHVLIFESLVVSVSAGVFGYLVGLAGAYLARPLMGLKSLHGFGIETVLASVLLAGIVGVCAAIYPAYKAAKLEPTVALRAL